MILRPLRSLRSARRALRFALLLILVQQFSAGPAHATTAGHLDLVSCEDVFRGSSHKLPCLCTRDTGEGSAINCDHVSFFGEFPALPFRQNIHSYSQRHAGIQNLEPQLFTASNIPLQRVDFSHNLLRRLMERLFDGVESTLIELKLGHNRLGDQLNPIFSTNEFLHLKSLRTLDLSYNELRALDSNLFRGLRNLTRLNLEGNDLTTVPSGALGGLKTLRDLNLGSNYLQEISVNSFPNTLGQLTVLNLTDNRISLIKDGAFANVDTIKELYLARNQITDLSHGSFKGPRMLEVLDLSNNFLDAVPTDAFIGQRSLKKLLLSSNNIMSLEDHAFAELANLEILDLSRNSLTNLNGDKIFGGLLGLRQLNLAYNGLKKLDTVDEGLFLPLHQLEVLDLTDNQLMNFPTQALNGLPGLRKLFLDYNKIGVLSEDALSTVTNIDELSAAYNLIHDLPDGIFGKLTNLRLLNLHGNKIDHISQSKFDGISENLLGLDIGFNDLLEVPKLDMPRLMILNVAMNQFSQIKPDEDPFGSYGMLRHLNVSFNQLSDLPKGLFKKNRQLEVLDLQGNQLDRIEKGLFNSLNITSIILKGNRIKEIGSNAFEDLPRLRQVDLSDNEISSIKNGAFDVLPMLKRLDLSNNKLSSVKGDFFSTRTRIEELELSNNLVSYLYPNSFVIHRRLRQVSLGHNKLSYFPSEILTSIRSLQTVDLSYNKLQSVEANDFANMPRLRSLNLEGNEISHIASTALRNSSMITRLNLSNNRLTTLDEQIFKGIARLDLDLSGNQVTDLPGDIFNRRHVFQLERVDLSRNGLTSFPADSLRKQYSCLEFASLSWNKITHLPVNSDVLVNVKELDLSGNPLTPDAQSVLFGEPKSTRRLNVASIGLVTLPNVIEMPFLKVLNLSDNRVSSLKASSFERTSLLKELDLNGNKLPNLNAGQVWRKLITLKRLYVSRNPIQLINRGDLDVLSNLELLDISKLPVLTNLECDALSRLRYLKKLMIYGYPMLPYLESQECLLHVHAHLESLAIELKESFLQGHLQKAFSPRMTELSISGQKLTHLSPSSLNGIKAPRLSLQIHNVSISSIPAHIFAPLPMSTQIDVQLQKTEITALDGQLVNALDSKQMSVKINGLKVSCDCKLEPLWRWVTERIKLNPNVQYYNAVDTNLTCSSPKRLAGRRVVDLDFEQLACTGDQLKSKGSTTTLPPTTVGTTRKINKGSYTEFKVEASENVGVLSRDRIPSLGTGRPRNGLNQQHQQQVIANLNRGLNRKVTNQATGTGQSEAKKLTKVDTMIIGIVAGVVAFVCILILIICVVRLKTGTYDHHHVHGGCTCSKSQACHLPPPASIYPTVASRPGGYRPPMPAPQSFYQGAQQPMPSNVVRPMPMKMVPTYGHAMGRNMLGTLKSNQGGYYMYSEDER